MVFIPLLLFCCLDCKTWAIFVLVVCFWDAALSFCICICTVLYLYCLQSDVCAWKAKWSCCSFNEEIPHQVYKVGKPLSFDWIELLHLIWNIHCNANWAFNQGQGRNNNWCKHSRQKTSIQVQQISWPDKFWNFIYTSYTVDCVIITLLFIVS